MGKPLVILVNIEDDMVKMTTNEIALMIEDVYSEGYKDGQASLGLSHYKKPDGV